MIVKMKVKLIVDGGAMKPGPAVAQQLGPMGINMGGVISDVNKETEGFKGVKVPVELDIDAKTKEYTIQVFSPPVSEMIKKELKIEKASGLAGKYMAGNIAFERVIEIAKSKQGNLLARNLRSSVRLVVGTCASMGILIDNKFPSEIQGEIDGGNYDKEISEEKTEVTEEKKKMIEEFNSGPVGRKLLEAPKKEEDDKKSKKK